MGEQEHRVEARLPLTALQERYGGRMQARSLRQLLMSQPLLAAELEQDMSEGLGRIQAPILTFRGAS